MILPTLTKLSSAKCVCYTYKKVQRWFSWPINNWVRKLFSERLFYNPKDGPCLFQVTIPLQPQQYPHGMDCRWVIVAPPGHIIKLTWMTFNLEESHTCSYDYLAVFDNTTIPGTGRRTRCILIRPFKKYGHPHQPCCTVSFEGGLVGQYCGNTNPPDMTSTENMLSLQFRRSTWRPLEIV